MDWQHVGFAAVFVVLGYWLAMKYPGCLAKAAGGIVSG